MSYDEFALLIRLDVLPGGHRAAFAAACAQRQLENYVIFHRETGWGDPASLAAALKTLWTALAGSAEADEQEFRRLAASCEQLAPDSSEISGVWTGAAIGAAASVTYALECFLDGDPQLAAWAARGAYSAVEVYVMGEQSLDPNDPSLEYQLDAHPFVQEELRRQDEDLSMLEERTVLDGQLLTRLEEASKAGGLRPLHRRLRQPRSQRESS